MKDTYEQAIAQIFKDEGGYTNESTDPGGPTNWGITIYDARRYWKTNATAQDVRQMPKSVAQDIYRKHYADPMYYDDLPAGVDYAVLDFGINSGISRAVKVTQRLVNVPVDGVMGPVTIAAINKVDPVSLIRSIYIERMAFLKDLHTWTVYHTGWTNRCTHGEVLAIKLNQEHYVAPQTKEPECSTGHYFGKLLNRMLSLFWPKLKQTS